MIKYFAVENFRSIREENIVEFDAGLAKDSPFIANPTIGIAGANASGKSSFLQALTFTLWFMQDSFLNIEEGEAIPAKPFVTCQEVPTKLHLIFSQVVLIDTKLKPVNYEYILCLTQEEVIEETLLYYPYNRKRIIYHRDDKNIIKQGSTITQLEQELWKNLRKNASVVSFASQFNSQVEAQRCQKYIFSSNLSALGMVDHEFHPGMIESLVEDHNFKKEEIIRLLQIADLGISDFEMVEVIEETKLKLHKLIGKIQSGIKQSIKAGIAEIEEKSIEEFKNLELNLENIDNTSEGRRQSKLKSFYLKHQIDNSTKNFKGVLESAGTLQFIALLYRVMLALKQGSTLIFDEIEVKLHQNLVAYIIGLFQNKYENPHGAQLIFSFHNTYFMDILEPSQLWFTEKNDQGYTEIFSADDFKDIKKLQQQSLEELYRLGRFGAKPRGI